MTPEPIFSFAHFYFIKGINGTYRAQLFAYVFSSLLINVEQDAYLIPQFLVQIILFMAVYILLSIYGDSGIYGEYNDRHVVIRIPKIFSS